MGREVPWRKSLLVKLMLLSALVSACSIVATAWLTVHSTAVAIRQEQGQTLDDESKIYDTLLGYAATHHDWSGARPLVARLAQQSGQRITLTDSARRPLVDSAGQAGQKRPLPAEASTTVDPLAVDTTLAPRQKTGGKAQVSCAPSDNCATMGAPQPRSTTDAIDPRAVGPFRLTPQEQQIQNARAAKAAACLQGGKLGTDVVQEPSGRAVIEAPSVGILLPDTCDVKIVQQPAQTETNALRQLDTLVAPCLAGRHAPSITMNLDLTWNQETKSFGTADHQVISSCVDAARKEQLGPYVAAPALLFLGHPQGIASTFLDLSPGNRARIVTVAALVLMITLTVTTVAGVGMVRPLRALGAAARRMTAGDLSARVKVGSQDEIGSVASAFNTMSDQRERSERLRKAMVSDVAHELRTPLSNIRGWLEAAEDGIAVPDKELLSALVSEAVVLQHIIDDLRDLSAADAGELRLLKERVDIGELLDQVTTAYRGNAEAAGLRFVTDCAGEPEAVVDPVRLRQAVGNLVSNAIRYTPSGGEVSLAAREEGGRLVIRVRDTGDGIAPEDLPRLFDRFWRAEKSRSRQTGGSGLGLSIVRKLAEAHGGTVNADSTVGGGSVFTLRIPTGL